MLRAISERGSLRAAAAYEGVTQPALTKLVRDIEDILGAALFERTRSGLVPTVFGQRLIERSEALLTDVDRLADELALIRSGHQGLLRIGVIPLLPQSILARAVSSLRAKGLDYVFSFETGSTETLVDRLRQHTLDCVLGRFLETDYSPDCDYRMIYAQKGRIIVGPGSPWLRRRDVPGLDHLVASRWILPPAASPTRRELNQMFLAAGVQPPEAAVETFDPRIIQALLNSESDLVAILPADIAAELLADGKLRAFTTKPPFTFPAICLILPKRLDKDSALAHFSRALEQAAQYVDFDGKDLEGGQVSDTAASDA